VSEHVPPVTVEPEPRRGLSIGSLLFGLILIGLGIVWLLKSADVLDASWDTVLPATLIAVGVATLIASLVGGDDGLVTIGVILAIILTFSGLADIPITGGIGDHNDRPQRFEDVKSTYSLMIGDQTVDLRDVTFPPGTTNVRVRQGVGDLEVLLPANATVDVTWKVAVGEATIFGNDNDGVGIDGDGHVDGTGAAPPLIHLDVSVGIGDLEVRHGS
jgi:hypothetical protein